MSEKSFNFLKRWTIAVSAPLIVLAMSAFGSVQWQMYDAIADIKRSRDVFSTEVRHELQSINAKLDGVYTRREAEQALTSIRSNVAGNTESIEANQERIRRLEARRGER